MRKDWTSDDGDNRDVVAPGAQREGEGGARAASGSDPDADGDGDGDDEDDEDEYEDDAYEDEDRISCPYCDQLVWASITDDGYEWTWDESQTCDHVLYIYDEAALCDFVYRSSALHDLFGGQDNPTEEQLEPFEGTNSSVEPAVLYIRSLNPPGYREDWAGSGGSAPGCGRTYFGFISVGESTAKTGDAK